MMSENRITKSLDRLSENSTSQKNFPEPIEPDVYMCSDRYVISRASREWSFAPDDCRRSLNSVVKYHEIIGNGRHLRRLPGIKNTNVLTSSFKNSGNTSVTRKMHCLNKQISPRTVSSTNVGEKNVRNAFEIRQSPIGSSDTDSFDSASSYNGNTRTLAFRGGQSIFHNFFVGDKKADFLLGSNLGWCVDKKRHIF